MHAHDNNNGGQVTFDSATATQYEEISMAQPPPPSHLHIDASGCLVLYEYYGMVLLAYEYRECQYDIDVSA